MCRAKSEYRYEKLTWPEINDAVDLGKVCIIPCGAVEQHGHHLPLDVDLGCPVGIANGTGREIPDKMLVLPVVAYGYTGHVMDFPGTINQDFEHFMHHVLSCWCGILFGVLCRGLLSAQSLVWLLGGGSWFRLNRGSCKRYRNGWLQGRQEYHC